MNLHLIDWMMVVIVLSALIAITVFAKKYNKSVADFLAANRMAGRYLLTVSSGFGGAISLVAMWEMVYINGLPAQWWGMMSIPLGLFIALTGFVVYRYRETKALTLAQFFEMRYSRKFRFFAGSLCWISGILNYGIFPAITAKFIIYFFGLPHQFILGGLTFQMYPLIMLFYLGVAVFIACSGGQISIMLTDFFQGILLMMIFLLVMFFILWQFQWGDLVAGIKIAPVNQSMINPFETSQAENFNIWYFLIGLLGAIYGVRAWQGNSGYNAAARTPHEAVMAGIIGTWRTFASSMCMIMIPLAAYAILHLASFSEVAAPIQAKLAEINDPALRTQMTVPLFLTQILPPGILGLFAVIVLACAISCDDTYIHAWGSIFVQDVVMPLRKKPFEPKQHMFILRCAIIGVALFGFFFSLFFQLKEQIYMYFALTGAIYLGGAGSVIIGGLYWKRGTTYGAWSAMIVGTVIGVGGIVLQQSWAGYCIPALNHLFPDSKWLAANCKTFPINGQYIYFATMVCSIASYVSVSLLGPRKIHDMDKLLNRTKAVGDAMAKEKLTFAKLIGINHNFSKFDRFIAYATATWSLGWWSIFLVLTAIGVFTTYLTTDFWAEFWWWKLIPFSILLGTICTLWIGIGGIRDAVTLVRDLKKERINQSDDGFVKEDKK